MSLFVYDENFANLFDFDANLVQIIRNSATLGIGWLAEALRVKFEVNYLAKSSAFSLDLCITLLSEITGVFAYGFI